MDGWDKIDFPDEESDIEKLKLMLRRFYPGESFVLSCKHCGQVWLEESLLGVMQDHMKDEHHTDKVELNMVWIGYGPAPKHRQPKMKFKKHR